MFCHNNDQEISLLNNKMKNSQQRKRMNDGNSFSSRLQCDTYGRQKRKRDMFGYLKDYSNEGKKTMIERSMKMPLKLNLYQDRSHYYHKQRENRHRSQFHHSIHLQSDSLINHCPIKRGLFSSPQKRNVRKVLLLQYNSIMTVKNNPSSNNRYENRRSIQKEDDLLMKKPLLSSINIIEDKRNDFNSSNYNKFRNNNHMSYPKTVYHKDDFKIINNSIQFPLESEYNKAQSVHSNPQVTDNNKQTQSIPHDNNSTISRNQRINIYINNVLSYVSTQNHNYINSTTDSKSMTKQTYNESLVIPNHSFFRNKNKNEKASRRMLIEFLKILISKDNTPLVKLMKNRNINQCVLEQEKIKKQKSFPLPSLSFMLDNSQSISCRIKKDSSIQLPHATNGERCIDHFRNDMNDRTKDKVSMLHFLLVPRVLKVFNENNNHYIPCVFIVSPSTIVYSHGIESYKIQFKAVNPKHNFEGSIDMLRLQSCNNTQSCPNGFTLYLSEHCINEDKAIAYKVEAPTKALKDLYLISINYLLILTQCKSYQMKRCFD